MLWLRKRLPRLWRRLLERVDRRIAARPVVMTGGGSSSPGPPGPPGLPGVAGHSPIVGFGSGADFDRLMIDGSLVGPHLTGLQGEPGRSIKIFTQSGEPLAAEVGDIWIIP